jgi:hypothetical protein
MMEVNMRTDGLQRMLDFLNFLKAKKINYFIEHDAPEWLLVTLTLVGVRVEVMFSVEDMTFSVFRGKEDVIMDEKVLYDLIKENWSI